jgi:hypothetical protein
MSKSRDKAEIAAIITENKNLMQTITQITEENREQVNKYSHMNQTFLFD